ncbi:hypothetical protein Tco_1473830 [Tanacetum coccineum]
MVVQNQSELGEGSSMFIDPHHTPTILQPSTQPQKIQKPRKPKRKDTQVPQSSDPNKNVVDEAIHNELGDSLVRDATTTSSLEAEQDSGNINKTRTKATPNESSSLETNSGGGPRCQETMGDTIAQTKFENVSKHSNDLLLARGNTFQRDEDRLKLDELMALCSTLQQRVLDLEKTKTTQDNEIASLKRRVNKLEKKRSSRTHKLKRLYKFGLTARVESSGDEESLGEDASKQGRINAIDTDEEITLVNVQDDADNEMFDVNVLGSEEVFVAGKNENVVEEVVNAAQVSTVATIVTITTEEITLAQALEALKTSKPKVKGIVFQEPIKFDEEERLAREKAEKETKPICQDEEWDDNQKQRLMLIINWLKDCKHKNKKTKRAKEKRNKSPTKAQQRQIMCTYLKNMKGYKLKDLKSKGFDSIQEMFDKAFQRVNTFEDFRTELVEGKENRAGEELIQESRKKQKVDDDKETIELKQCLEIIPDAEENILEDLYKLVKARYGSTRPVESMDYLLWNDMKIMFEPHVEDEVWKLQQGYKVLEWKLYDSCGVQSLEDASMQIYMLVEKKYPLTPPTLSMMLERSFKLIMKVKWLISCVN